jgi:hypothetical protein
MRCPRTSRRQPEHTRTAAQLEDGLTPHVDEAASVKQLRQCAASRPDTPSRRPARDAGVLEMAVADASAGAGAGL